MDSKELSQVLTSMDAVLADLRNAALTLWLRAPSGAIADAAGKFVDDLGNADVSLTDICNIAAAWEDAEGKNGQ